MKHVFIVEGWFGDQEWIERIFGDKDDAGIYCEELWQTRTTSTFPEDHYFQGVCKFGVTAHEVH